MMIKKKNKNLAVGMWEVALHKSVMDISKTGTKEKAKKL